MNGDDTFVVYARPRLWVPAAFLSVLAVAIVLFVSVDLWLLDPAILREFGIVRALMGIAVAGAACAFFARHNQCQQKVVLSADALGIWAGIWGRRFAWPQVDTITFAPPFGGPSGVHRFLMIQMHIENETALGQKIERKMKGRMIDLRWVQSDVLEITKGLSAASRSAGYAMEQIEDGQKIVWRVSPD